MPPTSQRQCRTHRCEVGAKIDDIGNEQEQHDRRPTPGADRLTTQVTGNAGAGDAADLGCDLLDHRHQREAQHHRPGKAVAELCTDLAVGGDAARIVVGRAGDQAGAEPAKKAPDRRRLRRGIFFVFSQAPRSTAACACRQCRVGETGRNERVLGAHEQADFGAARTIASAPSPASCSIMSL